MCGRMYDTFIHTETQWEKDIGQVSLSANLYSLSEVSATIKCYFYHNYYKDSVWK